MNTHTQTQVVEVSHIDVPGHFRTHTPESLESLSRDIQEHGLLQGVVVCAKPDGRYELVAGKGRLMAVQKLGWSQILAQVYADLNELDKELIGIAENEQREDVSPIDKALSYKRAMVAGQIDQRELAKRIGLAESTMSQYLALAKVPEELRKNFGQPKLGLGHLTEILRLPKPEDQVKLAEEASKEGLTSKEVRSQVSQLLKPLKGTGEPGKSPKEVPLFQFSWNKDAELLIKARYSAEKPLDGYFEELRAAAEEFLTRPQKKRPPTAPAAAPPSQETPIAA